MKGLIRTYAYLRKIIVGFLLLLLFLLFMIFFGWFTNSPLSFRIFTETIVLSLPLFLILAPLWSYLSDLSSRILMKKNSHRKMRTLSLLFHIPGGWIGVLLLPFLTDGTRHISTLDFYSILTITPIAALPTFTFWLIEQMVIEQIEKKPR